LIAIGLSAGGCSADVTRFDFPSFNLTNSGNATGSLPTPPEPLARREPGFDDGPVGSQPGEASRAYRPPPSPRSSDRLGARDEASLPSDSDAFSGSERPARWTGRPPIESRREPLRQASGETIQVQQGDTLYGIAKRYGVSIAALIEVNNLTHGSTIKPGQQLMLPAGGTASKTVAARQPAAQSTSQPVDAPGWEGRHTMKAGDSLYGIAHRHKVKLAELMRVNGITEPTKVRVGAVLRVPGNGELVADRNPPAAVTTSPSRVAQSPVAPKVINAPSEPRRTASLDKGPTVDAAPAPEVEAVRFRWPARGRIIAAFGKRPDGTHNDGINLAVPQGTEIHAAEAGRVAYAGNELKGYGNLILVRHDNGWVSAYAHAEKMLVKRDDVVKRGQVIAKAGKTGSVDQPQVHFELRQGSKPVDPVPFLERL
jgi:murein DD-endopeptidase MepM/ murein hydrolase activator NlpD